MKCILYDFRRTIAGRWFLAAFFATVAALYMSIGSQTYALIDQMKDYPDCSFFDFTLTQLLHSGPQRDFGLMTLPALSALPFAALVLVFHGLMLCCVGTLFPMGDFSLVWPLLLGGSTLVLMGVAIIGMGRFSFIFTGGHSDE